MTFISPGAIAFDLGFWQIRWYGILIASAILLSYLISSRWLRNAGFKESHVDGSFLLIVAFGLIGARAGSVLQVLAYYRHDWWGVFRVWDGGLSIHGAIIGGIFAILAAQKIYKFNFLKFANAISPQVLLSVAIGRWGNFFNEEISGRPYSGFLKLFISPANRLPGFKNIAYYHPVFLYESVLLALSYALFLILSARLGFKSGFFYTLIAYNTIRFFVEFWRIDYKPILWRFDLAQIVSFGIIIISIGIYTLTFSKNKV